MSRLPAELQNCGIAKLQNCKTGSCLYALCAFVAIVFRGSSTMRLLVSILGVLLPSEPSTLATISPA